MMTRILHYSVVVCIILLVSVFFSAFSKMDKRSKTGYLIVALGFLCFLTMFHSSSVGNDTAMYTSRFVALSNTNDFFGYLNSSTMEPGFLLYVFALTRITHDPQVLFMVSALIMYLALGRFIYRYCEIPGLMVFCIVTMQLFDMYLSGLRQTLAIAILLFAYPCIEKKQLVRFLILLVLAMTFHYTAVLFVVAYPLAHIQLRKDGEHKAIRGLVIVGGIVLVYVGFQPLLNLILGIFPKYRYYANSSVFVTEPNLAIILRIIVYSLMFAVPRWLLRGQHDKTEQSDERANKITRFALLNIVLQAISMNASVLARLATYCTPYTMVDYANNINKLDKQTSVIMLRASLVLFFFYGLVIVALRMPAWYSTYPYSFCFM